MYTDDNIYRKEHSPEILPCFSGIQKDIEREANGQTCCRIKKFLDVKEELRLTKERLRLFAEATFEGIGLSENGKIIEVNPQLAEILGYSLDEMIGLDVSTFVAPEDLDLFRKKMETGDEMPYEHRARRKDGSLINVEVKARVFHHRGRTFRIMAIRDITSKKKALKELENFRKSLEELVEKRTAELREINEKLQEEIRKRKTAEESALEMGRSLQSLLDAIPDAACLFEIDGKIIATNEAFASRFGVKLCEAIGKNLYNFWSQSVAERRRKKIQQAIDEKKPIRFVDTRDGMYFDNSIFPVFDEEGNVIRLAGVVVDITDRKMAELERERLIEQLSISNKELEEFAYIASHDLQEPLRKISNFASLLQDHLGDKLDEEGKKYLWYLLDGAKRMQKLIKDLLNYSRVGKIKEYETVDLNEILEETLYVLHSDIKETSAKITSCPLPKVRGNGVHLLQVFQNLISNAIKFRREEPPQINISVELKNGEWIFSIADNGIGIEPQYFDRIFKAFYRLHTRGEYPGTGIGLAICDKIIKCLGGKIWVESTPGKGSIFSFSLPALGVETSSR